MTDTVRDGFEKAIKHYNYPLTRKGEGYRSPMTQMAWDVHCRALDYHHPRSFQQRVWGWLVRTFGIELAMNREERFLRFLEEAIELVQVGDIPKQTVLSLVEYVYSREIGDLHQEVGGVMTTLAVLCAVHDKNAFKLGEQEYERILPMSDAIREKNLKKPHRAS